MDNAFRADFLDRLLEEEQPATASEAATAGPWVVVDAGSRGWAVVRPEDAEAVTAAARRDAVPGRAPGRRQSLRGGRKGRGALARDDPGGRVAAWLVDRADALLFAAALPGSGRRGELGLRPERGPDGYSLVGGRRVLGRLAWFDPDLVEATEALRRIVASPACLAQLLEASGHDALAQAGRRLARRRPPDTSRRRDME